MLHVGVVCVVQPQPLHRALSVTCLSSCALCTRDNGAKMVLACVALSLSASSVDGQPTPKQAQMWVFTCMHYPLSFIHACFADQHAVHCTCNPHTPTCSCIQSTPGRSTGSVRWSPRTKVPRHACPAAQAPALVAASCSGPALRRNAYTAAQPTKQGPPARTNIGQRQLPDGKR